MSTDTEKLSRALAGRYAIERELGAGGMATVYLAQDEKHDRQVAVKVLKPELAAVLGAERFVVEIKTTASLQHPHILPLFDSGTADGFLFYVMPYVQGETLRDKLNRETQFGVDEAVRIARDVADALDYAHRHGVIHRDIKPENILLHDGRPMVADFGIALAVSAAAGGRMTETGLSLGTPHYMSPEQATAEKEITARADIYSLGSVLYEMLTGNPPLTGASAQQIIMKIITEPAEPVTKYRKSVPPNVAAAVAKSLEKLPADRFESARAFGEALANVAFTTTTFDGGSSLGGRGGQRVLTSPIIAAALLAAVAVAGWGWSAWHTAAPSAKRTRFTLVVSDSARIRPEITGQDFTIAPDGSKIVYVGGNGAQLYLRSLDDLDAKPIAGTEQARQAKFSPDGKWLAFVVDLHLRKIPVTGGPTVDIADSVAAFGWGDDDMIVMTRGGALWRVNASGGVPTLVARPAGAKVASTFVWPFVLPGGKAVLFDIVTGNDQANAQLAAVRLDDGKVTPLGVVGRNPRYVATGHILYSRLSGAVVAAPFDAKGLRVTGPAVSVLDGVYVKSGGASEYGVAQDGTLFFVQGTSAAELLLVDRTAGSRPVLAEKRGYNWPSFSPSSGRIAFEMTERTSFAKTDIWIYNNLTNTTTRLTNDGNSRYPMWMADGERVVWMVRDSSGWRVRRQRWDGTGRPEELFADERDITRVSPSPSGNGFAVVKSGRFSDLYFADGEPPAKPRPLVVTPSGEGGPRISPDGRWVAYYSDESGQREVDVIAASGEGGRHQISTNGGAEPVWAPDGKTLYYRAAAKLVAAGIATTPAFTVTGRTELFADRFRGSGSDADYDVSRDGKTFVMIGSSSEGSQRIVVVTGWLDELRARMAQAGKP